MKKLFCIILALSLCGCTQPETQTSSTSSSTQTEIRLVCSEDTDKIEELTKAFEGENPEIKITVITTDRDDDFALATKALLSGQHIPTLILSRAEHLNDLADCFADLSNEGWANNALPNTLSEINREGKMIAMPAEIEGIGFVYDKDVFETANINPENINSIERLKATAEHLSEKLPELKKDAVFSKPDEQTVKYLINIVLSQECSSSLELMQKELELTFAESFRTLLVLQGSKEDARAILSLQSHKTVEKDGNFDMLSVPVLDASQDSIILNVPTYWAVNKNAEKKEQIAARAFLTWVYTSETGNAVISEKLGWISPFDNALKTPDSPVAKTVYKYAVNGKTMPYVLNGLDEEIYNQIKAKLTA